jgi:hypothetical protein
VIWVYGIGERPELPPPRGPGLAQAPLDAVREGELVAVISRHDDSPGALDNLWEHERVVEEIMADRAVLPARFGTTLDDEAALRQVLAERGAEFLAALARVRGRVEVGIRAVELTEAPPEAATTGRAYLEAKLERGRSAAAVHETLAGLAVEVSRGPTRADEVLRASYLIEAPALAPFRATVEHLQHAHPDLALLCTGPWPPYSFAGGAP